MTKRNYLDPARRVIAAFGEGSVTKGVDVVAAITGRSKSRVFRWMYPEQRGGTGGIIPMPMASKLLAEAERRNLALSASDFFASEIAA